MLAVAATLATSSVGAGLGLGLFGVLSIIRLRSTELSQTEVAYYFAALALGLLGGLGATTGWLALAGMALVVGVMAVVDHPRVLRRAQSQTVVVDRALADPAELTRYLEELLGAEVRGVSVQRLDLVNDTTWVDVRWTAPRTARRGARPAVLPDAVPAPGRRRAAPRGRHGPGRPPRAGGGTRMSAQTLPADDRARAALHPLSGVDLDELVATAALLTRVDRKYVLPVDDAVAVLDALARTTAARVLEIDGARSGLRVGLLRHARPRVVPADGDAATPPVQGPHAHVPRLRDELPRGQDARARGTTLKQRVAHDCPTALDGGQEFVHRTLAAEGIDGVPEHALAPGLVSRYRRTTLLLPGPTAPRAPPWTPGSRGSSTGPTAPGPSPGPSRTWWSSRRRAARRRRTSTGCCGGTGTAPSGSRSTAPGWRCCAPTCPTAPGGA